MKRSLIAAAVSSGVLLVGVTAAPADAAVNFWRGYTVTDETVANPILVRNAQGDAVAVFRGSSGPKNIYVSKRVPVLVPPHSCILIRATGANPRVTPTNNTAVRKWYTISRHVNTTRMAVKPDNKCGQWVVGA